MSIKEINTTIYKSEGFKKNLYYGYEEDNTGNELHVIIPGIDSTQTIDLSKAGKDTVKKIHILLAKQRDELDYTGSFEFLCSFSTAPSVIVCSIILLCLLPALTPIVPIACIVASVAAVFFLRHCYKQKCEKISKESFQGIKFDFGIYSSTQETIKNDLKDNVEIASKIILGCGSKLAALNCPIDLFSEQTWQKALLKLRQSRLDACESFDETLIPARFYEYMNFRDAYDKQMCIRKVQELAPPLPDRPLETAIASENIPVPISPAIDESIAV